MRRARGQHPVGNAVPFFNLALPGNQGDDADADNERDDDQTLNGDENDDDQAALAMIGAMVSTSISQTPTGSPLWQNVAPGPAASLITQGLHSQANSVPADDAEDSDDGGSTVVPPYELP